MGVFENGKSKNKIRLLHKKQCYALYIDLLIVF